MPAFYYGPQIMEDMVDFLVGKVLESPLNMICTEDGEMSSMGVIARSPSDELIMRTYGRYFITSEQ